ncbi:lytic transglycosylase [Bifidobacterium sp. DSM 109958]|uniref:Lytic transglycosylase n=1 Tax=Bifidobacterium moraviense TaxID=2675323 RepID=A0A7Y0I030_9BIFI|nr:G5 domain-containing protein [Bifidobacterium sp. DSM 109958]NMN01028.1 lytic transglycosylase [Bifidobacterium sp. DSM 109958]
MARRWTPQRFVMRRRMRVAACVAAVMASSVLGFGVGARKAVALDVNGNVTTVTTYAMSVDRLLAEQGVDVKTHDLVQSVSGTDALMNNDVVTVRSAFQTTIVIDGTEVPFWTVATSADQLLGFFESSEADAAKVTVDIKNVYNQLTGGFVINQSGPVTVIADGRTTVAPDGKLPAASILDSQGITLGKEDRVSVERNGDETILRVKRVTHGQTTKTSAIPHGTQTVIDSNLAPGQTEVRQVGEDGEQLETYDATFVDGVVESETLVSTTVTKLSIDTVIAVGPDAPASDGDTSNDGGSAANGDGNATDGGAANGGSNASNGTNGGATSNTPSNTPSTQTPTQDATTPAPSNAPSNTPNTQTSKPTDNATTPSDTPTTQKPSTQPSTPTSKPTNNNSGNSNNSGSNNSNSGSGSNSGNNNSSDSDTPPSGLSREELENWWEQHNRIPQSDARLWHPTVAQAKAYARGAAAQRGWTGAEWDALETMWTKESGWRWSADNPSSSAYGIPQSLPGQKMGYGWQDDGAVQIDWGLKYIAQRYGSPTKAWAIWQKQGWY